MELLRRIIQSLRVVPAKWLAKRRARYLGRSAWDLKCRLEEQRRQCASPQKLISLAQRLRDAEMRYRLALRSLDRYDKEQGLSAYTEQDRRVVMSILGIVAAIILLAAICTVFVEYRNERDRREKASRDLRSFRTRVATTCPEPIGADVRVPEAEPQIDHIASRGGGQSSQRGSEDSQ
jgi:hypothetical protein